MQVVIIDNEAPIRRTLKQILKLYCPGVEVIGEANGVQSGLELLAEQEPDLVFLDIEMNDGTGLDLLQQIPNREFEVVFVTAYDRYALEAFKFSAIDYLLKPVDPDDLVDAVNRAKEARDKANLSVQLSVLLNNMQSMSQGEKKIVLRDTESIYVLEVKEIIRCQAEGSYTRFFLGDDTEVLVSRHLKSYEQMLAGYGFFRSHHSHLINLHQIKRFDKSDGGMLIMRDQSSLPVSSRRKTQLLDLLENL